MYIRRSLNCHVTRVNDSQNKEIKFNLKKMPKKFDEAGIGRQRNMSQEMANRLAKKFKSISDIDSIATYMQQGDAHQPTTLNGRKKGVYAFLIDENTCFKVGKANVNSAARWNSQHYCLDGSTPSTLTKSILSDLDKFKSFFVNSDTKKEIEEFKEILKSYIPANTTFKKAIKEMSKDSIKELSDKLNLKDWIRRNIARIEFVISGDTTEYGLNLLEALIQFELKPIYEGKNA